LDEPSAEFVAAMKKLGDVPCDPKVAMKTVACPLNGADTRRIAFLMELTYRRRPGFAVAAVPSCGLIVVRADAATMDEALRFARASR
jgi:hypothetical protein